MFNYKTWKLYYPHLEGPTEPEEPAKDSVVDENGNSITPDSLKKNMTIPAEAPGNDLEKVLSNMNGADPAHKVDSASGLIKQMNELAENPPSGGAGGFDYATFDGVGDTASCDKTFDEISKMKTPIGFYETTFFMLHYRVNERTGTASYSAGGFVAHAYATAIQVAINISIDSNNNVVIATQSHQLPN